MKYFLAILLIITLNANTFAASGICMMEHDNISIKDQTITCHETERDAIQQMTQIDNDKVELHLCDCDMSSQFIYRFVLNIFSIPVVSHAYFNNIQHQLLTISSKYRPPILFHS